MSEQTRQLYRHSRWANRLMLEACRGLTAEQLRRSVPGTYGELGRTLAHLAGAEAGYVHRLSGEPRRFMWRDGDQVPPVEALIPLLAASGSALIDLAEATPAGRMVDYTFLDGRQAQVPAWVILNQALDHAKEHRTHAATILTQLGIEPPDLDSWSFGEVEAKGGEGG